MVLVFGGLEGNIAGPVQPYTRSDTNHNKPNQQNLSPGLKPEKELWISIEFLFLFNKFLVWKRCEINKLKKKDREVENSPSKK